jgi:ABC-type Fe3+ transport system permease subunit
VVVEDQESNVWASWFLAVIIALPLLIVLGLLITFLGGPLHNLWFNYAWSSDKGNGPEAIQQTILYALVAALFIPIVRHFIQRELKKAHDEIHDHLHDIADKLGIERYERKM